MRRTSRRAVPAAQAPTVAQTSRSGPSVVVFSFVLACVGLVWSLVWAVGIVPAGTDAGRTDSGEELWLLASWIGLVAGSFLLTPVHELGHALAAAAMRLPVVSVRVWHLRFGRPDQALPGTSGHVTVALVDASRWLPGRMIVFSLGGSAATVAVALATASTVVSDPSAPTGVRALAVGLAVAGFCDAIASLVPMRRSPHTESDGRVVLRWLFRPTDARSAVGVPSRRVPHPALLPPHRTRTEQQREVLVAGMEDKHPDVAIAAVTALFNRRLRWNDGWQDYDAVAAFAAREDLPADVRAGASSQYCLSLAFAHLVALRHDEPTGPESSRVRQLEQLAELALAAKRASLQARTAMALVRIIQMRPTEARALLGDDDPGASPIVQARASAVLGIAEVKLGNLDRASDLARLSRRHAPPTDPIVRLVHTLLARSAS